MKSTSKSFVISFVLILVLSAGVYASEKQKSDVVTIKTSAICGSCKKRIEKVLLATPGVEEAILNLNNKKVKVQFDPSKTNAAQLRQVIANTGYDADDVKKNEEAFTKLPECCQRPMEGDIH
jgi:copper chaperone CopZ